MHPFFSIITPSLQRQSLIDTCVSIDRQSCAEWEHIIMVDQEEFDHVLLDLIAHPRRKIFKCSAPHRDGGNTCRHNAWPMALGSWTYYVDDDNFISDERVFADIYEVLSPLPETVKLALFPINRLGARFFSDPPKMCHTDTLNMVIRTEVSRWPMTTAYGSDGLKAEELMAQKVSYIGFPDFRPIAILPKISFGK